MATITSAQSGNFSNPNTWIGGVVPGVNDVANLNQNHIVQIDIDIIVQALQLPGNTSNSYFTISGNTTRNVTLTFANGFIGAFGWNAHHLFISNSGTTNLTAGFGSIGTNHGFVSITGSGGIINIYPTQMGGNTNTSWHNLSVGGTNNTVNIIANLSSSNRAIVVSGTSNVLNFIGNLTSTSSSPITLSSGNSVVNLIGNAISNPGTVISASAGQITIEGFVTGSGSAAAIINTGGGQVLLKNCIINNNVNGRVSVYAVVLRLDTNSIIEQIFNTPITGQDKSLYTAGVALGNPLQSDVRDNITYGPNNELTGTLKIPHVSTVLEGVPIDNTTGTAAIISISDMAALLASYKIL